MANIPPIDKFKFFSNMALPLVYDETLSYYETLNKVVYKLNEIINLANTQSQAIEDFETQVTEFVTTWENNLMQELEEWKTDTEEDIDGWLNNALNSITAWEEQFENEYAILKDEVEQIAEDADAAKTAAENSATAAADSASAAESTAQTIAAEATQIDNNTENITNIKAQLALQNISELNYATYTNGGYINTRNYNVGDTVPIVVTEAEDRAYSLFDCSPGEQLTITGTSGSYYLAFSFLDENNVLIAKDIPMQTRVNYVITAPDNTAKALVCANTQYQYSCIIGKNWKTKIDKDTKSFYDFIGEIEAEYNTGYIKLSDLNIGDIVDIYTPVQAPNRAYAIMDCSSGDAFRITGKGGSIYRTYAFVDSNNALLTVDGDSTLRNDFIIFAPQNAAKIIVDTDTDIVYSCTKGLGWKNNVNYASNTQSIIKENSGIKVINDIISEINTQSWNYATYDVTGLSNIKISTTAYGKSTYPCYIFYDDNGNTNIGWYEYYTNTDVENYIIDKLITVPIGATHLIINKHKTGVVDIDVKAKISEQIGRNKNILDGVYAPNLNIIDGVFTNKLADVVKHNTDKAYLNIAFLTDTHANTEDAKEVAKLMHKINELNICDFKIHGGDVISTGGVSMDALDFDEYITEYAKYVNEFKQSNLIFLKGNHDDNHNSTLSENATKFQWNILFQRNVKDAIVNPADPYGNYFYIDDAKHNIRIICLNAFYAMGNSGNINFGSTQVEWLTNTALNLPSGYKAIVFSHAYSSNSEITSVLANANNLIGIIYGHTHVDNYSNTDGFNAINVRCAYDNNGIAMDIFTIDTDNSVLYETRFGKGTSRSFNF